MSKPLIFIDTEFNGSEQDGFSGKLLSMALVDKFNEFYEVLCLPEYIADPWVEENVIPVFNKEPIVWTLFTLKIQEFLSKKCYPNGFIIIADWPDDIKHFCDALITSPGHMIDVASFECRVIREINSNGSRVPHNALEDARAIRDSWLGLIL